ncbi:energy transducer TonB [Roseivirga sp. UBA838]|uniref:energy transducer TonB n=1 Tax=Roseivirga sp. UBA838 TaxID=1947393 RepID=UPI00257B33C8|nr:energy transducer TonB [Roseivirga sp. UBA838]|tara:strand:+ start:20745 stop:21677 length:933 start_codon:yes stop_codon:yes gene_type:complete
MRTLILSGVCLLLSFNLFSQANDTTYYSAYHVHLDDSEKEHAAYYELNNGKNREGKVDRFFPSHEPYGYAHYKQNILEGFSRTLFKNGRLKEEGNHSKLTKIGVWKLGFENGQSFATLEFGGDNSPNLYTVISLLDSLGNTLVKDGSGFYKGPEPFNMEATIEGEFRSGIKVGEWVRKKEGRTLDKENYSELGEFVSGTSWDKEGNIYHYTEREVQAEYVGGVEGWHKHLQRNLKYPKKAKRNNIEGAVFLSFIVDKNGEVSNVEVLKGIGYGCDEEAIRVVESSKWLPGLQRGQPVKSRMAFRIVFRLR